MPSGLFHTKVTFGSASGNVADDATTSFSYIGSAANTQANEGALIVSKFNEFLNVDTSTLSNVGEFLGASLSRTVDDVKVSIYGPLTGNQLGGAIKGDASTYMGSPVYEDFITLVAPGNADELPRQAAIDLVLRASGWAVAPIETADGIDVGTAVDRPRQRKTGRMKLGPWTSAVGTYDSGVGMRPSTTLVSTLLAAAQRFQDGLKVSFEVDLAVWSRVNKEMLPVTDIQVPNAFSNAIRRKVPVTNRNTAAV